MSNLYHPLKALGLHASAVPLYIKAADNKEFYLFSAVGSYFLVYKLSTLALIGISDRIEENILSITGFKNQIFCGCETKVFAYKRAKHVSGSFNHESGGNWKILLTTGDEGYLCGVNENNNLIIWNVETSKLFRSFNFEKGSFTVTHLLQPATYKHKILIAAREGIMQLINYMENTVLYVFKQLDSEITAIQQSPQIDIVAIGCRNGSIYLLHLKYDEILMHLQHDVGSISCLSFRTDLVNELILVAGSFQGHVTLWDLKQKRSIGQTRDLHLGKGGIATVFCVPNRAELVSSGANNSLCVWKYDRPDGTPSLFRDRTGHSRPPQSVRSWPSLGNALEAEIVSAGAAGDLRVFNASKEFKSFHLRNVKSYNKDIIEARAGLSVCPARDGWWDSIALCISGNKDIATWSHRSRTRGKHHFYPSLFKNHHFANKFVTARQCAISPCGNFVVVGYSTGHAVKFNIQSSIERGIFQLDSSSETILDYSSVIGLEIALATDKTVLVTAHENGTVALYEFSKCILIKTIQIGQPLISMKLHSGNDMVAIAATDGKVYLVQLNNFVVFRAIQVLSNVNESPIVSMAFTRFLDLLVVAHGNTIKTFDFINNKLVDVFRIRQKITQIEMAPNDAYLITIHENDLGVYLWSLKLHHCIMNVDKLASLSLDTVSEVFEQPLMSRTYENEDGMDNDSEDFSDQDEVEEPDAVETPCGFSLQELGPQFSGLSLSYFSHLSNIDRIRVRNERAAKGLASEAFFLPEMKETLEGLKWVDDEGKEKQEENSEEKVKKMREEQKKRKIADVENSEIERPRKEVQTLLATCLSDADWDRCMDILKMLTPTALDHEIKMLDPVFHDDSFCAIDNFIRLLDNQLKRGRCIDLCPLFFDCLLNHNIQCLAETRPDSLSGIEGVMAIDVETAYLAQKNNTLKLIEQLRHTIDHSLNGLQKDLNQIICLCHYAEQLK